jgi:predicted DNA-binding helix-hairpin-helix protein
MDISEKAKILYDGSQFDLYSADGCIYKTLMTNECYGDCRYCINTTNCKKARFKPEELAKYFMHRYKESKGEICGLFLSSAMGRDVDETTEDMLRAVLLLRKRYHYKGYIHFKILPGVNYDLIKRASEVADRMSVNLEAPSKSRLSEFCSVKEFYTDIIRRQKWIKKLGIEQTTQFVVGANDETDLEILKIVDWQNKNIGLKRSYFSAFFPIRGTKYENRKQESFLRQNRLYNIDFLLRLYGIKLEEVKGILNDGMLPRNDPKLEIAKRNLGKVDLRNVKYEDLIKVPGIGIKTAKKILTMKNFDYESLKKAGVIMKRATPFIEFGKEVQTRLFSQ